MSTIGQGNQFEILMCEERLVHNRRTILAALPATALAGCSGGRGTTRDDDWRVRRLRHVEETAQGRLGVYVLDAHSNRGFGWRENEHFAHCSSFKMSLAAMVLSKADHGDADLGEVLRWRSQDMLSVSPVTEANIDQGLSVEELARATLVSSDNTAANVLLRRFGGPPALTAFWRSLGDTASQLDRFEPELNEVPPGTTLDTTTPRAMALTMAALVHGDALNPANKDKLKAWMTEVQTGTQRIRAGLPKHWQSGDKTGTGIGKSKHTYVDIAFGGPAGRAPLIITAYFEPDHLVEPMDPISLGVLAEVGRTAALDLVTGDQQGPAR
jgi:beta-lactamase class A